MPAWTARSPASCSSSRPTGRRRRTRPQHHALRHLQRRRHLEPRRQQARLPQPAPRQRPDRRTSCRCKSRPSPGSPPSAARPDIDWDDIHLRVEQPASDVRPTKAPSRPTAARSPSATADSSDDLWVASTNGGQLTRLTTGNMRPTQIIWSKPQPSALGDMIYFRDGTGIIRMVRRSRGRRRPPPIMPFQVKMTIRTRGRIRRDVRAELAGLCRAFLRRQVPRRRLERRPRQVSAAGQARRHEGRPVRRCI